MTAIMTGHDGHRHPTLRSGLGEAHLALWSWCRWRLAHMCRDLGCVLAGHLICASRRDTVSWNHTLILWMTQLLAELPCGRSVQWISKYLPSVNYISVTPPLACRASEFALKVSYFMRQYSKIQAEQPLSFNSDEWASSFIESKCGFIFFRLSSFFLFSVVLLLNP